MAVEHLGPPLRFSLRDMERAAEEWGANCGPGAIAAATRKTLDEVRPHLRGFDEKRYMNPTMMLDTLNSMGVEWFKATHQDAFPLVGVARIQWLGPWLKPGVNPRAAYGYTHWVASIAVPHPPLIFDVNAMAVGGWVLFDRWKRETVPWIIENGPKRATGWSITHSFEIPGCR